MIRHEQKHLIPLDTLRRYSRGRPLYAMVLSNVKPIDPPLLYRSRPGPVTVVADVEVLQAG